MILLLQLLVQQVAHALGMAVNSTGALPDSKAMLDVASINSGILIPRMTTTQRDAIASPPNSLQIYNTVTNRLEVYSNGSLQSVNFTNASSNQVYIYSLADLPIPAGSGITLDATKMYVFNGMINISPYYLNLNGANLRGNYRSRDGVMSTVSSGILRSNCVEGITRKILAIAGAKSPFANGEFTIVIAKNGTVVSTSTGAMAPSANKQSFQVNISTEVDLTTNDYLEVFFKTLNSNTNNITMEESQFKITG